MEKRFQLTQHNTSASREILCGVTTFLTMSYILFVNPAIVSGSGMPAGGVFTATVICAAACSIGMGLFANVPFGMAPGMGLNTFFTYVICMNMGFHWKEGLAVVFAMGLLHILVMVTGMRKTLVNAIPNHLKMAFGVGLGLFLGYAGLKNGGFLMFTAPPGQYAMLESGTVIGNSGTVPALMAPLGGPQIIAGIGLAVILMLLALERKTGESYAALPIGILTATFIGIPLNVTDLLGAQFIDFSPLLELGGVFCAFFGDPGLSSILADPHKMLLACLAILVLLMTNVMDSIGTIIGTGQMRGAEIFSPADIDGFRRKDSRTKMDRVLIWNSFGSCFSALMGTTPTTTYMESITGVAAGGRTGLAAVTVGVLFLVCLPLANFFSIIPSVAVAPALIVAGGFMISLVSRIDWSDFEQALPAFITILCIPLTYSIMHGIAFGVFAHVIIQIALGQGGRVHIMLYGVTFVFAAIIAAETLILS